MVAHQTPTYYKLFRPEERLNMGMYYRQMNDQNDKRKIVYLRPMGRKLNCTTTMPGNMLLLEFARKSQKQLGNFVISNILFGPNTAY